jgi:hypothetical protein
MTFPRYFIWSLIIMMMIPLLAGCAATAGKAASFAVSSYCKIPSGTIGRKGIRETFNKSVYPHKVEVTCAHD